MLASFAAESELELAEGVAELRFASAHKLCAFLSVQDEVELGDGLDLESLARLAIVISLHGAEDDVLVLVGAGCAFESWLEAHAGAAPR